nr:hypothetical protein [Candidatus Njordarchaeota archaeon]
MKEELLHSTGETAGILGDHFNIVKRCIYTGRVKATKTLRDQYRISTRNSSLTRSTYTGE